MPPDKRRMGGCVSREFNPSITTCLGVKFVMRLRRLMLLPHEFWVGGRLYRKYDSAQAHRFLGFANTSVVRHSDHVSDNHAQSPRSMALKCGRFTERSRMLI
jgi:hypothetical protein